MRIAFAGALALDPEARRAVPTPSPSAQERSKQVAVRNLARHIFLERDLGSDSRAPTVDQFLVVARDDHAVMVTAEVRHVADRFQCILREYECAAFHPLEAAKDLQDVFSVIGNMHRLAVDANVLEALDRLPCVGVDDDYGAFRRFLVQFGDEHF